RTGVAVRRGNTHRSRGIRRLPGIPAAPGVRQADAPCARRARPRLRRRGVRRPRPPPWHGDGLHRFGCAPELCGRDRGLHLCEADALAFRGRIRLPGCGTAGVGRTCAHLGARRHPRRPAEPAGADPIPGEAAQARGVHLLHLGGEGAQSCRSDRTVAAVGRAPGLRTPVQATRAGEVPRRLPVKPRRCGHLRWTAVPTRLQSLDSPGHLCLPCRASRRSSCRPITRSSVMTSRRDFIASASLAATGLALAPLAVCSQDRPDPASPRPREKPTGAIADIVPVGGALLARAIPATGETIPVIGVGTSGSYEVPLDSPEFEALEDVMKVFFEGGGRLLDTSPNYSNAEDVVGALLAGGGWRERCFLATKLAAD